ncbi:hypothetical protein KUCAC02_001680 [Chaenocephalus aceratus]|uniref:Uncharacterized protein n=1 Tax=Chaenocephalus aceratus TaxID=36190 RepID=A0ACB9XTF4_CHAAC|nr:hypothetical protein KUCAC02_001680 [Chaenocephalus aceratus]
MATQAQKPPTCTWRRSQPRSSSTSGEHFDADGNGFIEGKELENFFKELETARRGAGVDPTNAGFKEKMKEFMAKFDQNEDGRIEMSELAQLLPTEENFLLCFREFVGSSSEFMAAWRRYDTDRSGYIELRMFDLNGDGKLGLSEMARLLPVQENFLMKFEGIRLKVKEFDSLFTFYDKDGNGYIDEQELDGLLKDLCDKNKMDVDPSKGLVDYKRSIMALSDGGEADSPL